MAEPSKTYSIPVPAELDTRIRADMARSGFNSLSEYVRDALRARLERSARQRFEARFSEAAQRGDAGGTLEEVLDRLRDLAHDAETGEEAAEPTTRKAHGGPAGPRPHGPRHPAVATRPRPRGPPQPRDCLTAAASRTRSH